jgi:hypothetical protein
MTPKDDYSKLYKPMLPAFHKNTNCPFIHSDYDNFTFPANFKELYGEDTVEYFRKWFKKEGENLLRKDEEKFSNYVTARWPGKRKEGTYYQINWKDFIKSEEKNNNSGIDDIDSYNHSIEPIMKAINNLKIDFKVFQNNLPPEQKKYFLRYIRRTYVSNKKI